MGGKRVWGWKAVCVQACLQGRRQAGPCSAGNQSFGGHVPRLVQRCCNSSPPYIHYPVELQGRQKELQFPWALGQWVAGSPRACWEL